tara:strand:- start:1298 stop:2014 length:717 start_codon:yes stop_codon:yes gene_type:complete
MKNKFCVIALGGSVIVPHLTDHDGINTVFLRKFRTFLLREMKKGKRFVVVTGGGRTTRVYQKGASKVLSMISEDLDWIGIHATRLNAHLLRTIFRKQAYPWVIDKDPAVSVMEKLKSSKKSLFVASGWKPGWSTDYIAVRLAQKFGAKEVIDAGDISFVYDGDPKKNGKVKSLKELSWKEYKSLIPATWSPGMAVPFDPVATRLGEELGLRVKILKGTNLKNMKRAIEGKSFQGTQIF